MSWATEGRVSADQIDGGLEITREEYKAAIAGMTGGKIVSINGGFAVLNPPEEKEPEPQPPPPLTPADAKATIIAAIDAATAALLAPYPVSERMSFDAKAAEARAVLAADPEAFEFSLAPLLGAECGTQLGEADDATRRTQIIAKATLVHAKAVAWGALAARHSGLRQRAFAAIDAAEDGDGRQAAMDAALTEVAAS